jgi:hypothetical protein
MSEFTIKEDPHLVVEFRHDELAQADPLKLFFPSKFILTAGSEGLAFEGVNGRKRRLGLINGSHDRGSIGLPRLDGPWRVEEEEKAVREALEAFVKACLQCRLLKEGGTMLHAAGLAYKGEGYAFAGHTRAGKTTLTRGLPAPMILGDDLLAVRMAGAEPLLFGTPWPGREGGRVAYGGITLRAIFNLHPGPPLDVERMGAAEAVAELAANAPRLGYEGEEDELLEVFSSAVAQAPIYKLSLSMGDDVMLWLEKFVQEGRKGNRQDTGRQDP